MSRQTRRPLDSIPRPAQELHAQALIQAGKGDPSTAERLLRAALAADSDHAPSLRALALLAGAAGRDAECVVLLERAAAVGEPEEAAAAVALLAAAHRRAGRLDAAEAAYRDALARFPDAARVRTDLASLLRERGRADAAVALCREGLAAGEEAVLLNALGVALKESGDGEAAAATFERAVALAPDFVEALYNLATARKDAGATGKAVALFRRVVALAPDLAAARFALCMAHLSPIHRDRAEAERRRAEYAAELDRLIAHAERHGYAPLADGIGAAQPFLLAYQGRNDVELQRRYGTLVCRAAAERWPPVALADPPVAGERVRLGVVCGYVRDHSVWRLPTRGWVEGMDRRRFELILYHTAAARDDETRRAEAMADRFVQGPLATEAWRERIAADRPHALIYPEIGMDPMAARLAAMRLAPVQYCSWGHPSTSGYPTIDAYLSSAAMEPPDAQACYTERLVRLAGLSTPIRVAPFAGPAPPRSALGLPDDAVVFWCAQSLPKYQPDHDHVFPAIAARAPDSRFVFIASPDGAGSTRFFRDRLSGAFAARGLDAERHVVLLPPMTPDRFTAAMGAADVALDSLGWSGCNTLIEALRRPLPIVTCPGATMRSRHGAALLAALGEEGLICADPADYVERAVALARDPEGRRATAARLASRLPRLADAAGPRVLEAVILRDVAAR